MGPTASGKTDLAIELAQRLDCELVSVDSALVYRGLDIGSAKPDYPHHLVNIRDPAQIYSAADFVADAERLAADIIARGKTPLLVGGTMLYFKAFLEGLDDMPGTEPSIRTEIAAQAALHGWAKIHEELAQVDPVSATRIHPNHSQRLSRALEVYRVSGMTMTQWQRKSRTGLGLVKGKTAVFDRYRVVQLAICPAERNILHQRIALRFELMMAAGLLDEVRGLWQRQDLNDKLPAMRAVGYRQLWQHLEGECTLDQGVNNALAATRQLAKRQLTWLRKWVDLNWIYTDYAGKFAQNSLSEGLQVSPKKKPLEVALNYLAQAPL
ncbi:MAG: tRNA (adenosine(37)-N6)-dimethylallyltransferase MiaA [Halioglobus sp.]|nr:tRNA (adenosine(37)-N6)-dimethylallyltransferase MiaA [Halioglobus sp.]